MARHEGANETMEAKKTTSFELKDIGERIATQDNAITSHPVFMVQRRERIYGVEDGYNDGWEWSDKEDREYMADEKTAAILDTLFDNGMIDDMPEEWGCWERIGYKDLWHHHLPFFTRRGAEHYLSINGHNLGETRIYVESGYRNIEWQTVREYLLSLALSQEQPES